MNLIEDIKKIFSDLTYPNDKGFYHAIADRDYLEIQDEYEKKEWEDVTKEDLVRFYDFIFFLDHDGVIYYLPAYMCLILEYNELADCQCLDSLLMTIIELENGRLKQEQYNVIYRFLLFCRDVLNPEYDIDMELCNNAITRIENRL